MRITIPVLVAAAFVLAACSSTSDNSGDTGSTGASSSGNSQVATAPAGPKPGSQLDLEINVGDRVLFAFDSSALSAESRTDDRALGSLDEDISSQSCGCRRTHR